MTYNDQQMAKSTNESVPEALVNEECVYLSMRG